MNVLNLNSAYIFINRLPILQLVIYFYSNSAVSFTIFKKNQSTHNRKEQKNK